MIKPPLLVLPVVAAVPLPPLEVVRGERQSPLKSKSTKISKNESANTGSCVNKERPSSSPVKGSKSRPLAGSTIGKLFNIILIPSGPITPGVREPVSKPFAAGPISKLPPVKPGGGVKVILRSLQLKSINPVNMACELSNGKKLVMIIV